MRETITHDMIAAVQDAMKTAEFDGEKLTISIFGGKITPCSITQGLFPFIIDLALEQLKRKASYSLVEWMTPEQKTSNIEYKDGTFNLINKPLPLFDWSLAK